MGPWHEALTIRNVRDPDQEQEILPPRAPQQCEQLACARETVQLMSKYDPTKITGHVCMYGMRGKDKIGEGPVKTPTGWLTNSEWIGSAMSTKREGNHRHVRLVGGKQKRVQQWSIPMSYVKQ